MEDVRDAPGVSDPRVRSQYLRQVNNFIRRQFQNKQSLRQTVRRDSARLPVKASQYGRPRRLLQYPTVLANTQDIH